MTTTGTFQLDGVFFPKDPLTKTWSRPQLGRYGTYEPIQSGVWRIDLSFGFLESETELEFLELAFQAGGVHTTRLPHPQTGLMTDFSGVAIEDFTHTFSEFDSDGWSQDARLVLSGLVVQEAL